MDLGCAHIVGNSPLLVQCEASGSDMKHKQSLYISSTTKLLRKLIRCLLLGKEAQLYSQVLI